MNEAKSVLLSKTYWTNFIIAVVIPFLPPALNNPVYIGYAVIGINLLLRRISHGKVELKGL